MGHACHNPQIAEPTADAEIDRLLRDGNQARLESLLERVPMAEVIVNDALSGTEKTTHDYLREFAAMGMDEEARHAD